MADNPIPAPVPPTSGNTPPKVANVATPPPSSLVQPPSVGGSPMPSMQPPKPVQPAQPVNPVLSKPNPVPKPNIQPVNPNSPSASAGQPPMFGKPLAGKPISPQAPTSPFAAPPKPGLPGAVTPVQPGASPVPPSNTPQPPAAPGAPQPTNAKKAPQPATAGPGGIMGMVKKYWPIGAGVFALLILVFGALAIFGGGNQSTSVSVDQPTTPGSTTTQPTTGIDTGGKQVTLTYWGLWEDKEVMGPIIKEFEEQNPNILVSYVKQSPKDYRQRLQTAIAGGQGPDLFRFHGSWTPMLVKDLSPVPNTVMSSGEFLDAFYPVASEQLQANGQFMGVPLTFDSLMLYYNKEILATAGVNPPKTWSELRDIASKLTIKSGDNIQRGGLAIGNTSNVDHFAEILGLLLLQNGADLSSPTGQQTQDALTFYTNFYTTDKVWSDRLPNSTVAFARGEVAMMFAPSWRAHEITAINPDLQFGVAPTPSLGERQVSWGYVWAEGVNAKSKNKDASWALIKFLSTPETMQKLYASQSQVRKFGEPYSRPELASSVAADPVVGVVMQQGVSAKNWYLNSFTFDSGLNDRIIKYYQDAINEMVNDGEDADNVVATVARGVQQLLNQYGLLSAR